MRPAVNAVIDTNVVLDWLLFDDPAVRPLADAVQQGQLVWLCTQAMLDELAHVLQRRPFDARWTVAPDAILAQARRHAQLVEATPPPGPALVCRDADDQKFIDLALAQRATWLISRDRALLALARRALPRGVQVLPPARWQLGDGAGG
ncbi:putative toxin-antitoxin system toxin component, PIN family [Ideonella sp. DXS22W]|uniref:Toxin-antitoxin system toxin component, PIN family n=1 Tax=Pseudaquabacterium inlustre TaxID=2984192 RepID=A0ABU9CP45_9BURK